MKKIQKKKEEYELYVKPHSSLENRENDIQKYIPEIYSIINSVKESHKILLSGALCGTLVIGYGFNSNIDEYLQMLFGVVNIGIAVSVLVVLVKEIQSVLSATVILGGGWLSIWVVEIFTRIVSVRVGIASMLESVIILGATSIIIADIAGGEQREDKKDEIMNEVKEKVFMSISLSSFVSVPFLSSFMQNASLYDAGVNTMIGGSVGFAVAFIGNEIRKKLKAI